MPIITSLSTRFLGHPRLTKPTFVGAFGFSLVSGTMRSSTVVNFFDMQSYNLNIPEISPLGTTKVIATLLDFEQLRDTLVRSSNIPVQSCIARRLDVRETAID